MLLTFEHVSESHTRVRLACILHDILMQFHIKNRIYAITIDNANNNLTMHTELTRIIRFSLFKNVETNLLDSSMQESNMQESNLQRVSCLAHVIQLTLFDLLRKIRIQSNNDDFQTR